ncbi:MAG: hypothetical protein OER86_00475, partial [Phycisphaerae bacterium]|nr:hypothetical protein [Phycisphaerae bacterium]
MVVSMVSPATDHPLLIWTDGDRAELIEALLARLPGVVVQAVGGPSRAGLPELAERFGSESQN